MGGTTDSYSFSSYGEPSNALFEMSTSMQWSRLVYKFDGLCVCNIPK